MSPHMMSVSNQCQKRFVSYMSVLHIMQHLKNKTVGAISSQMRKFIEFVANFATLVSTSSSTHPLCLYEVYNNRRQECNNTISLLLWCFLTFTAGCHVGVWHEPSKWAAWYSKKESHFVPFVVCMMLLGWSLNIKLLVQTKHHCFYCSDDRIYFYFCVKQREYINTEYK